MGKEETLLKSRYRELAERAYRQNIYTYTSFLSVADQTALWEMEQELAYISFCLFGGVEGTERMVAAFGSEETFGYREPFPICCIHITPLQKKFAEELSHRDYLGALMHLGIERDVLGDIMVRDADAYVFCLESMAEHIINTVTRIRHTSVRCERLQKTPEFLRPHYVECQDTVASRRIDVVVASVYHLSRSQTSLLFTEQKISVDGRVNANHSYLLKDGDTVSVRGYGRFIFERELSRTRKGKLLIAYRRPE